MRFRLSSAAIRAGGIAVLLAVLAHDVLAGIAQIAIWPADFASYYVPARAVMRYPSTNVYDYSNLLHLNNANHYVAGVFYPYVYPPFALIALRPLAALSFATASTIWIVVSHLCAIGAALLLADAFSVALERGVHPRAAGAGDLPATIRALLRATNIKLGPWSFPTLPFAAASAVLLCAWPAWDTYYWGQINFVIVFLLVLALHAYLHDRPVLAGAALALAGALKLTPLFLVAFFVLRGAWKAVASALGLTGLLAALPLLVFPAHNYVTLFIELRVLDGMFVLGNHNESFIAAFPHLAAALGHTNGHAAATAELLGEVVAGALVVGTLAVVLLLSASQRWPAVSRGAPLDPTAVSWLGFVAVLAAYVLVTPLVWSHYYIVALPAALMLAVYPILRPRVADAAGAAWDGGDTALVSAAVAALVVLMYELPLGADRGLVANPSTFALVLLTLRPLGVLAVWGAAMYAALRLVRPPRFAVLPDTVARPTGAVRSGARIGVASHAE